MIPGAILVFAGAAHAFPTDILYAFTIWPTWLVLILGLALSMGFKPYRRLLVLGWLAFAWFFVEEARTIPAMLMPEVHGDLRVVSLNCAGGDPAAAREVAAFDPDIVLLQESPGAKDLQAIARGLFGAEASVVTGPDAAILARGRLVPLPLPRGTGDYVAARLDGPVPMNIVSLRLLPPTLRFDLWNPEAWSAYGANRAARREELAEIASRLARVEGGIAILGGDFNTPPDRGITAPISPSLRRRGVGVRLRQGATDEPLGLADSFRGAGVGHGATAVNPWPLVRIDQIWHGSGLRPVRTASYRTRHSDHCLVVADFSRER
ncbi:MAG TPA: endonuclease/exonuclease/phosphatase family protein [Fimbriimonas sp.]